MADAPAKPPAKKKGGALSGKFHGIPIPAIAVGGGVGLLLVYRWYKARKGTSSTPAATGSSSPQAATGADSGLGAGFAGTGGGSGGGGLGGDSSTGGRTKKTGSLVPADTTKNPTPPVTLDAATKQQFQDPVPTPAAAAPLPTQQNLQSVSVPVAQQGSTATGAGGNPNGVAGTFNLPKGVLNYQPTAAVVNGNQVAYGLGNQGVATQARNLGGTVESGKQLMAKGWSNLTPGAQYLVR